MNKLSASHENVYLFDTDKIVCPVTTWNFSKKGVDIYIDDNHFSYGWTRDFLVAKIYKFINFILNID